MVSLEDGIELLQLNPIFDDLSAVRCRKYESSFAGRIYPSPWHRDFFFSLNLKIPVFKAQFEWQSWIRNTSRFLPMGLIPLGTRQRFLHLQSWTLTNFYRFIETLWKRKEAALKKISAITAYFINLICHKRAEAYVTQLHLLSQENVRDL